jgi:NADP-dependent 3-hydroxy acid dehydrogenase YdfG
VGKLGGQVAIVTGAGSGIGRAAALMLAAEGATVVAVGRRPAPLDALVAEIARRGGRADAWSADVGDPDQAVQLARAAVERHGRVDILVNNAGSSSRVRNIRWVGREEWERVFAVNMTGVYLLTQAVLPGMIERGGGTIVTVSSAAAFRPGLLGGAPILPAEVDTPILENRPLVPDARARATMMQPEDVAAAILLCVTMPSRTVVEEIILSPTTQRDLGADLAVARDLGGPGAPP